MKIVIIGQGAIGLLWYYHLSRIKNNTVKLLCSKNTEQTIDNMTFVDSKNQQQKMPIQYAQMKDLAEAKLIIFCLKAYQLQTAIKQYLKDNNYNTPIILCHNGMVDSEILPRNHTILTALITHGAKKNKPFFIQHTGQGNCDLGLTQGDMKPVEKIKLLNMLNQALPHVFWHDDIKTKQWTKLAVNCVINPLTAIHNCNNGELLHAKYQQTIQTVIEEIVQTAAFDNIQLLSKELQKLVLAVAQNTAKNCSSMRADILANRQTEIDYINGFVHKQGIKHSCDTPVNSHLYQAVLALT